MPFVGANGLRLFYADAGAGPPLLLLMGHGLDHGFWAKQIPVYGEHFRCLALDNRGIGHSQVPPAGYSVEDMATDTLEVMDALGLDRAHLSGFSMGGSIALAMALRAPERVLSLSLHSTCGRQYPFIKHRYRVLVAVTRAGDPDLWAEATVITAFSDAYINAHDDEVEREVERRRARRQAMTPDEVEGLIGHYLAFSTYDPWDKLGDIAIPTLITVGAGDAVTPVVYSEDLHARIKGSELHIIPDAPHRALTFAAEEFNRISLPFLLRHRDRAKAGPDAA
jgi:pimeloyl-ACP methyl ester carboxylesterase